MGEGVTIIIPTLNEVAIVGRTLLSVVHAAPSAEIIVVDGGSEDGTIELAECFPGVRVVPLPTPGRATQCNAGARAATSNTFLFLHADTILTREAILEMMAVLQRPAVIGGGFRFALADVTGRYRVTEWGANFRSRWMRLPFGDQGIFCRRAIFEQLGGFPEIPLMDDVAFIRMLRQQGRYALLRAPVYTSARRIVRHGVLRSGMRNWALLMAYTLGTSPQRLARMYHRKGDGAR